MHTNMYTQTHTDRYRYHFYILHFLAYLAYMPDTNFIYGIPQTYTSTVTQAYIYIDTYTCTETLTHRYRDTSMFVYVQVSVKG